MGKSAVVIDRSMMNVQERIADGDNADAGIGPEGDRAFDDLTDIQNEDFIYVY